MCGRFVRDFTWQDLCEMLGIELPGGVDGSHGPCDLAPSWNVAPMQHTPVVRSLIGKHTKNSGATENVQALAHDAEEVVPGRAVACSEHGLEVALLRWGLIPAWSKDESIASRLINARAETIASKPAYRVPFARQRCVIPVNGFYEWKTISPDPLAEPTTKTTRRTMSDRTPNLFGIEDTEHPLTDQGKCARTRTNHTQPCKQPYYITPYEGTLLALAGLWEAWQRPVDASDRSATDTPMDHQLLETFTIITTVPNATVAQLHNRMPAILPGPDAVRTWLDPATPLHTLQGLLVPAADNTLRNWPVSSRVNNPAHNNATLTQAVTL